jgi:hypothetical protein
MGKLNVVISDEVEDRFRKAIARRHGVRKGIISKYVEEALELWIRSKSEEVPGKTPIGWTGKYEYLAS